METRRWFEPVGRGEGEGRRVRRKSRWRKLVGTPGGGGQRRGREGRKAGGGSSRCYSL